MARPVEVVFWIDGVEELSAGREKAGWLCGEAQAGMDRMVRQRPGRFPLSPSNGDALSAVTGFTLPF